MSRFRKDPNSILGITARPPLLAFTPTHALWLGAVALSFAAPFLLTTARDLSLLTSVMVYFCAAYSLKYLYHESGQLSLAHGSLVGVGAYAAVIVGKDHGFGYTEALLVAGLAGAIASLPVGVLALRASGHYFVILTFVLGTVYRVLGERWESVTNGFDGLTFIPEYPDLGLGTSAQENLYYLSLVTGLALVIATVFLSKTRLGFNMNLIRENEPLAKAIGVNSAGIRIVAFAISGFIAGASGQLVAYQVLHIDPRIFGFNYTTTLLMLVILAGKGSAAYLLGASFVYFFTPEVLGLSPTQSQLVFGLILVSLILAFPKGLAGIADLVTTAWASTRRWISKARRVKRAEAEA